MDIFDLVHDATAIFASEKPACMANGPIEAYVIGKGDSFSPLVTFSNEEFTMFCRGVRGATTVEADTRDEILSSTRQLLALMIRLNGIDPQDVGSAIFSTTVDLNAEFPALAARQLGWLEVPLLCTHELDVPGSLRRCIRVLINWNTDKLQHDITHVYIKEAVKLRPDLCNLPPVDMAELEAWIAEQVAHYKK